MGGQFVLEVSARVSLVEGCLVMEGVGFHQSLWEKSIWEGVWLYLDPIDSVCLRTVSMDVTCFQESMGRMASSSSS